MIPNLHYSIPPEAAVNVSDLDLEAVVVEETESKQTGNSAGLEGQNSCWW